MKLAIVTLLLVLPGTSAVAQTGLIQQFKDTTVEAHKPGTRRVGPDSLGYVWVPAWGFTMGCSVGDKECEKDEVVRYVVIGKGFWMGETEVTQAAYKKLMGANPSAEKGASYPVENVTWAQAKAYCAKVGGRLPTEEEWEFAARAGSEKSLYGYFDAVSWNDQNSEGQTRPVKKTFKNPWGLYDMLGNVWEWTNSDYNESRKVVRGGSFRSSLKMVRVSRRGSLPPETAAEDTGFRCVLDTL